MGGTGGGGGATLYLYDASGARVGKMSIPSSQSQPPVLSCKRQMEKSYILGPRGETMTMLDGSGNWKWTNVYAGGKLLATYAADTGSTHLHLTDMVGTRRLTTDYQGWAEIGFTGLPFGDDMTPVNPAVPAPTADEAPPMHFTGKQHDEESGDDYFGARYYTSTMGRFLTPDWSDEPDPVPYADLQDPQTLNLYSYVLNNPLTGTDPEGHWHQECTKSQSVTENVNGGFKVDFTEHCQDVADWWDEAYWAQRTGPAKKTIGQMMDYIRGHGYFKIEGGIGIGDTLKLGSFKFNASIKDTIQTEANSHGGTKTDVRSMGVSVEAGGRKFGLSIERSTVFNRGGNAVDEPTKTEPVLGVESGPGSVSGSEVGVGDSICLVVCGGVELGVDTNN